MEQRHSYRMGGQVIVGIGVILFGSLLLLDNMGILDAYQYLRYWPVILIVLGLMKVVQSYSTGGRFWGLTLVLIGSLLLLRNLDLATVGIRDLWPLLLILLGVSLVGGGARKFRPLIGERLAGAMNSDVGCFAFLGGSKRASSAKDFRGAEMTAIMGGCEVDLRQADIEGPEAVISTFALWGGIEIQVPRTWSVVVQGFPFLGGFEDKTLQPTGPNPKRLIVRGTAVMGGVEISN